MSLRRLDIQIVIRLALLLIGVVTAYLVGWQLGDGSLHDWVLICAGTAELFGVLLIATPEIAPLLRRTWSSTSKGWEAVVAQWERAIAHVRHRFGQPHSKNVYIDARSGSARVSGGGSISTSSGPGKTLEEKVDFLLRREEGLQNRLDIVAGEINDFPERWAVEIEEAESGLRAGFNREIREVEERHIQERLLGIVLVLLGIVLNTWGNLI